MSEWLSVISLSCRLTRRAESDVKMLGWTAWRHDRINATISQFAKAEVTEEGIRRENKEKDCDQSHDRFRKRFEFA